jgi:hypothetical protein
VSTTTGGAGARHGRDGLDADRAGACRSDSGIRRQTEAPWRTARARARNCGRSGMSGRTGWRWSATCGRARWSSATGGASQPPARHRPDKRDAEIPASAESGPHARGNAGAPTRSWKHDPVHSAGDRPQPSTSARGSHPTWYSGVSAAGRAPSLAVSPRLMETARDHARTRRDSDGLRNPTDLTCATLTGTWGPGGAVRGAPGLGETLRQQVRRDGMRPGAGDRQAPIPLAAAAPVMAR